ncbi:unnamed protein product [Toxocara canis]|uniref:Aldo_ket_red domain-containing protein n=1 Tax=Toxocara canis TaxID=6265 RepID=A0A183TXY0_TOXCA|nr:unnamed protein product [Toxocara canis]
MAHVPSIKLATGADLPLFGLGTWLRIEKRLILQSTDPDALTAALRTALDVGYRLIDTAYVYGNEAIIGKVLQEYFTSGKLKRSDLFITSKLPFYAHSPNEIEPMLNGQLKDLQLDYLDLYLIHVPCPCKSEEGSKHGYYHALIENGHLVPDTIDHLETWRVLEKLYKEGKVKAIGVSNFNQEQIQNILDHATVKPHNLQVEMHLYWPQNELYEFCKKNNITMTAYGPLGSPGRRTFNPDGNWPEAEPMKDPLVLELASKYRKTPAQILLRYMVQRCVSTIPKSTNVDRVRENFNIFDFNLSNDEMNRLSNVETRIRLFVFDMFVFLSFFIYLQYAQLTAYFGFL